MYNSDGDMAMAIWDGRYCIVKEFKEDMVIVKDDTGEYCNLESVVGENPNGGNGHPGITGYLCSNPGDIVPTEEYYFTFDQVSRTITGYSSEGPKNLIIPCTIGGANVEYIGDNAFASMELISVIMPDIILTIGIRAFNDNLISNLELSNSVEIIGTNAFAYNNLTHIVFPDSLRRIENSERYEVCGWVSCWWLDRPSFIGNPLQSVIFGGGLEYIGQSVFRELTTLTAADLSRSNSLTTIATHAFRDTNVNEIIISSSAITINAHAFYNINAINISINSNSLTISESAFQNNRALVAVTLGENINSIGANAFENSKIIDLTLSGTINSIGTGAFQNNLIENINWGNVVVYGLAADAFKNNQLPDVQAFIYDRDLNGAETTVLASYAGANRSNIVIPDNITSLVKASFNGLGLTGTLNTGNGVTLIENSKFASNLLQTVIFGNGVTAIGASAFMSNQIGTLTLGNSLITIGTDAFRANNISNITWGSNVEIIGTNAFAYNNLQNIVFPDSVRRIENSERYQICGQVSCWWVDLPSFIGNPLQSVTFGGGLEYIGQSVFRELTTLTAADLSRSNSLTTIATHAFRDTNVNEIIISSSAITINAHAFYNINAINISINSNSLTISESAFQNNRALVAVTLGENINSIGANAFENSKIIDLTLSGTINSIGTGAFQNNLIENINWGNVVVYGLAADAFKNNQLPDVQAFIYDRDLNGAETTVLASYAGANRSNIVIPDNITSLVKASFNGLGLTGTLNTGNGVTLIENSKFASNLLQTVIFGNGVTAIGASAFMSNQIGTLTLGNSLITIGTDAFRANNISNITWGSNVEIIGTNAFAYNNLQNIVFPDSVRRIENSERYQICGQVSCWWVDRPSFIGNPLQSVTFGSGLEYIGQSVFRELTTLTAADLSRSNSLTTIAAHAFNGTLIAEINIPSSVTTILDSAFASNLGLDLIFVRGKVDASHFGSLGLNWNGSCDNIIYELASCYVYSGNTITGYEDICIGNIEIPDSLGGNIITAITDNAFANKALTRVVIPSTVTTIGANAFAGNNIDPIVVMGKSSSGGFSSVGSNWHGGEYIIYENDNDTCFKVANTTVNGYYLESVCPKNITIPNGITTIAANAFISNGLTSVNFNNVEEIGNDAFKNNNLTSITIPNNVTVIGSNPFTGNLLSSVTVLNGTKFTSLGVNWHGNILKVVFEGDSYERNCFGVTGNVVTNYPLYCPENVVIPASVEGIAITGIGNNAFKSKAVRFVTLGSHIVTIGDNAFESNNIAWVDMNEGIETIGYRTFYNTGLEEVKLPASLMSIGADAFAYNSGLNIIEVLGKTSAADFDHLGSNWNGSCLNIVYLGN